MSLGPVEFVPAGWEAPPRVRALTTCRRGGFSQAPYDTLNLALHVDDEPAHVHRNRARLRASLEVPAEPRWLGQVHGARVIDAAANTSTAGADASFTDRPGVVCAVLTADCLPLFLCDRAGRRVALAHVGWRGLAAGVVDATVAAIEAEPGQILAWLGPAIGPRAFEVGDEVRTALADDDPQLAQCFRPALRAGHWFANLYRLVAIRLRRLGVAECAWDESLCTLSDAERFFSYRREPLCGRMASLIWIA